MTYDTSFVEVNNEPLHQEVYKNNYVRIYRAILKPGDSTDFHRHSKNTLYVSLRGGNITTQTMKGTPICPTVLSKRVSLFKRIFLLSQKVFCSSLKISSGFVFYMPSEKYPVIHRAIASNKNIYNMDLMGIEVLFSNLTKYRGKEIYGKNEIESDEIMVSRISMNPNQRLSGKDLFGDGIIIVLSGKLDIKEKHEYTYLQAGDYYLTGDELIQEIENQGLKQIEILNILFKK